MHTLAEKRRCAGQREGHNGAVATVAVKGVMKPSEEGIRIPAILRELVFPDFTLCEVRGY